MPAVQTDSQPRWFLATRVRFAVSCDDAPDGVSVMESIAPHGDSPPLHVHHTQDEVFHVLAGALRLRVGDAEVVLAAGDSLAAPRGVPHTYRVESAEGARWLVTTVGSDFERFVRSFSRPAEGDGLPPLSGPPSPDGQEALVRACLEHGIELVGPPL